MRRRSNARDSFANLRHKAKEPDGNKQYAMMRFHAVKKWRVLLICLCIVITLIGLTVVNLTQQPAPTVHIPSMSPAGKTAAYNAVQQWMTNGDPIGPDPQIISWDGAKSEEMTIKEDQKTRTTYWWSHAYTVETGDGNWWEVRVLTDGAGNVEATPTPIQKVVAADQSDSNSGNSATWPNTLGAWSPTSAGTQSIEQWAVAFIGDDPARLKITTGDPSPSRHYRPLALKNVASVSTTVSSGAYLNEGKVDKDAQTSNLALAQVQIDVKWKSKDNTDQRTDGTYTYDVLVTNPDGVPHVCSWGPAGMGAELTKYSSAWKGAAPSATGVKRGKYAQDGGTNSSDDSSDSDSDSDDSDDSDSDDSSSNDGSDEDENDPTGSTKNDVKAATSGQKQDNKSDKK